MSGRRIDYFQDPDAPHPTRIIPAASVAVINEVKQLLMIRRADNDQWAIPGGKQEVGETPMEAGRREVREETGIECEITGLVGIFSNPRSVIEYTRNGEVRQEFSILFTGRPVGGKITTSTESREVCWFSPNDVIKLPMTLSQQRRVRYFLKFTGEPYLE